MDKAYISYKRFKRILDAGAFFVTRLQANQDYRRVYSKPVDKSTGIICDQVIKMNNFYPSNFYPNYLIRIKYRHVEGDKKA